MNYLWPLEVASSLLTDPRNYFPYFCNPIGLGCPMGHVYPWSSPIPHSSACKIMVETFWCFALQFHPPCSFQFQAKVGKSRRFSLVFCWADHLKTSFSISCSGLPEGRPWEESESYSRACLWPPATSQQLDCWNWEQCASLLCYHISLHTITLRKGKDEQIFCPLHSREGFKTYKNVIGGSVSLTLGPEQQM